MTVINLQDRREQIIQAKLEKMQKAPGPPATNKQQLLGHLEEISILDRRFVGIESAVNNQALFIQELMKRVISLEEKQLQLISYIRVMAESLDRANLI